MAKIPVFALLCPAIEGCGTGGRHPKLFYHQEHLKKNAIGDTGIYREWDTVPGFRGLIPFAMQERGLQRKEGFP